MPNSQNLYFSREEIIAKHERGEALATSDLFALKSRSFVKPVGFLENLAGGNEYNLRSIVEIFYCFARALDEKEDGKLIIPAKKEGLAKDSFLLTEVTRRSQNDSLDDLINTGLKESTEIGLEGATDDETKIFIKHFGNGIVLKDMLAYPQPIKEIFRDSLTTMISGMTEYLDKREIKTLEELNQYVYYVAGIVGEGLCRITNHVNKNILNSKGIAMDREMARAVGKLLQITNILKNIREDADARSDFPDARSLFLPRDLYPGITPQELVYGGSKTAKTARKNVLEEVINLAYGMLPVAVKYVTSVPQELSGYKAFCTQPIIMAGETLKVLKSRGAEEVFAGTQDAIKISAEQFKNINSFTEKIIKSGKTNEWLYDYSKETDKYTFNEGGLIAKGYEKWSKEILM